MNDMQMTILNMMQQVTTPKPANKQELKPQDKGNRDFRDMMNQAQKPEKEPAGQISGTADQTEVTTENVPSRDTIDLYTLQELAAMQMMCAAPAQQMVVQEETADQSQVQLQIQPQQQVDLVEPVQGQAVAADAAQPQAQVQGTPQPVQNLEQAAETAVETDVPQVKQASPQSSEVEVDVKQDHSSEESVKQVKTDKPQQKLPEEVVDGGEARVFSKVETVPVKVSEAAAEPTQPKDVETQVTNGLKEALAKGDTKVEIRLTPEHLGKLTIELTRQENGALHIVLHAESSHTKALLERDMSHMQTLLSRDTQQQVLVEVHSQQETQQKEFYDGHQQQNHHQQQEQHHQEKNNGDFLNQLRLGLVSVDEADA